MAVLSQIAEYQWARGFDVNWWVWVGTGVWRNISKLHPNDMVSFHPDALQCCQWWIYREADEV